MIRNLLDNWKTTAAGLSAITTGAVRLFLAIRSGNMDELVLTGSIGLIITGIGLLAAGDASKSQKDVKDVDAKVDQTAKAVSTGNTEFLPAPTPPAPKATTPDKP